MAILLRHTLCTSCGHQHNFCLLGGDLNTIKSYEYRCPETGQQVNLQPNTDGETVHFPPQGAVVLSAPKGDF
jgi:hypothetical protein